MRTPETIRLFADDCMLYRSINSDEDRLKLQEDLDGLLKWEEDWKMQFHPEKCIQLSITLKRKPVETDYMMRNHQLEKCNSAKYLGVTISSNLSWSKHIEAITSRSFSKLAFLQRNIAHCPRHTKTHAPSLNIVLEYGILTQLKTLIELNRCNEKLHVLLLVIIEIFCQMLWSSQIHLTSSRLLWSRNSSWCDLAVKKSVNTVWRYSTVRTYLEK